MAACVSCSHPGERTGPTTPVDHAGAICRKAVPTHLVNSTPTIVKDFRQTTIGTVGPAQINRFPGHADSDFAAWCWTGFHTTYAVYEVTDEGDTAFKAATIEGMERSVARGRPAIP